MKIVIKIPEHYYENNIKKELPICLTEEQVIAILPKGHGDLIDRSNLITITDISADGIEFTYVPYSEIENAPTIIEADISGKE